MNIAYTVAFIEPNTIFKMMHKAPVIQVYGADNGVPAVAFYKLCVDKARCILVYFDSCYIAYITVYYRYFSMASVIELTVKLSLKPGKGLT